MNNKLKVIKGEPIPYTPSKKLYFDVWLQKQKDRDEREQLYGRVPIKNRKY